MRDYRKYEIWKKSHQLALDVYRVTKSFPKEEMYGITSQLRRCSLSIPTNIVEGSGRNSQKEFAHFINIASGSAAETEYLIRFSFDVKYLNENDFNKINEELTSIRKMLNAFHQKIKL